MKEYIAVGLLIWGRITLVIINIEWLSKRSGLLWGICQLWSSFAVLKSPFCIVRALYCQLQSEGWLSAQLMTGILESHLAITIKDHSLFLQSHLAITIRALIGCCFFWEHGLTKACSHAHYKSVICASGIHFSQWKSFTFQNLIKWTDHGLPLYFVLW